MKTLRTYVLGFFLSIVLTIIAFGLNYIHDANGHVFPTHEIILPILIILAIGQLLVQLLFFLHLGEEKKPRWNLLAFSFALLVVVILVGGTLWIMQNLKHGQMDSREPFEKGIISPQTEG